MYTLLGQTNVGQTIYEQWDAEADSSYKDYLQPPPADGERGFKQLQWTPDGSSLVTVGEDGGLRFYVCPPDILETNQLRTLHPLARRFFLPRISSIAVYPQFSLSESRCLVAVAAKDSPIRLYNLVNFNSNSLCSYSVKHKETEEYKTVLDTSFSPSGHLFAAGSKGGISIFQADRSGAPELEILCKNTVSAVEFSSNDVLATGTFSGECSVYDVRTTSVPTHYRAGNGTTTQLLWSQDSNYLFQIYRRESVQVLDVRRNLAVVQTLNSGLDTNLRLRGDVCGSTFMVGSAEGKVRVWQHSLTSLHFSDFHFHDGAVTAVTANPLVGMKLLASCSQEGDASLKLWGVI